MRHGNILNGAIAKACQLWPQLKRVVSEISPDEACRRWIGVIRWRLEQTRQGALRDDIIDGCATVGAFSSSADLETDVSLLLDAIAQSPGEVFVSEEITTWLDRIVSWSNNEISSRRE